jgi:hypothetical protein
MMKIGAGLIVFLQVSTEKRARYRGVRADGKGSRAKE